MSSSCNLLPIDRPDSLIASPCSNQSNRAAHQNDLSLCPPLQLVATGNEFQSTPRPYKALATTKSLAGLCKAFKLIQICLFEPSCVCKVSVEMMHQVQWLPSPLALAGRCNGWHQHNLCAYPLTLDRCIHAVRAAMPAKIASGLRGGDDQHPGLDEGWTPLRACLNFGILNGLSKNSNSTPFF